MKTLLSEIHRRLAAQSKCTLHFFTRKKLCGCRPGIALRSRAILALNALVAFQFCSAALADSVTIDSTDTGFTQTLPTLIPVNDLNGVADAITLTGMSISSISDVTLSLNISGGSDGDFYAYLWHQTSSGTVMDVLFDQIGVTPGNPNSYGLTAAGMNVTFSDSGAQGNIQSATGSSAAPLTGNYQPDQALSSFDGMSADGTWALFIADVSSPAQGTLESWSLNITGSGSSNSVPDGVDTFCLLFGAAGLLILLREVVVRNQTAN